MHKGTAASRVQGIDGLRALCIVAIIIYHLNLPFLPSGHMGVVVFLVLSGYFATLGITRVYDAQERLGIRDLLRAWGKRILRVVPSVFAVVAITGVLCATLNHVLLTKMRPDVIPSLGFFLNWSYVLRDVSYFDMVGGSSPLLHLWYIGVDLQFFAVWALVLTIVLRFGKEVARRIAFLVACASAALMFLLYVPGADPSRVYYGTDTRAFSLLLGSWLALAFPLGAEPKGFARVFIKPVTTPEGEASGETKSTIFGHLLAPLSLGALICAMVLVPADSHLWYQGGMVAFSLVATLLVATLLAPRNFLGMLLGLAPLRVLGTRSFALYLWHYPILLLMAANKTTTDWWMRAAAVGVALIAAEVSLRLIERPFMRPTKTIGDHAMPTRRNTILRWCAIATSSIAIVACGAYTFHALETIPGESLIPDWALVSSGVAAAQAMDVSTVQVREGGSGQTVNTQSSNAQPTDESTSSDVSAQNTTPEPVEVSDVTVVHAAPALTSAGKLDPVLIGDSVPGDAGNDLVANNAGWEGRLPDGLFDSFIGRRPDQALDVIRGYLDQDVVGNVVVMACFSNSTPYPDTLEAMIEAVGPDRQLFLVGTVNPDGFQDAANANLQEAAQAHDNVHYVDWPAVLNGHMDEYLWADQTHLRPEGARVYVDMVVRAIAQTMVDAGGSTTEG